MSHSKFPWDLKDFNVVMLMAFCFAIWNLLDNLLALLGEITLSPTSLRILKKARKDTTQKTLHQKLSFSIFTIFSIFSLNFRSWSIDTHFVTSEKFSKETLGVHKICLSKKTDIRKYHPQKEMFSKQYGCRWRAQIRRAMKTVRYNRDQAKGSSSPAVEFA